MYFAIFFFLLFHLFCYYFCIFFFGFVDPAPRSQNLAPAFSDQPSRGYHVESRKNKKFLFCTSKLILKFFTARLDVQNVLFLCKIVAA